MWSTHLSAALSMASVAKYLSQRLKNKQRCFSTPPFDGTQLSHFDISQLHVIIPRVSKKDNSLINKR
jgi:hypothetical protein